MTPLTPEEIAELKAVLKGITPLPDGWWRPEAITAVMNAAPRLLATIDARDARLAELEALTSEEGLWDLAERIACRLSRCSEPPEMHSHGITWRDEFSDTLSILREHFGARR